jgi:peptidoglycan-associated lipoprotein
MSHRHLLALLAATTIAAGAACGGNKPPVARPTPPPTADPNAGRPVPPPSTTAPTAMTDVPPPPPPAPITANALPSDPYANKTPDEINQESPLQPVFFATDSDQLDDSGRRTIETDATFLKAHASWVITIEGHCDERGTAEYNLALGERRAQVVKAYLQSLGLPADRFRTVSYGKEFPFDPGHAESAWAKNRRAHLMVTSK